jgi:hypothetical protein
MKQKMGKRFILIPIGLTIISGALIIAHYTHLPDALRGIIMGFGIGLMILPLAFKNNKPKNAN